MRTSLTATAARSVITSKHPPNQTNLPQKAHNPLNSCRNINVYLFKETQMKLVVKPKVEKTTQYNMRLPMSLKEILTTLAPRADAHGTDLNATIVAMIQQLAVELTERFDAEDQAVSNGPSTGASTNPSKVLGRPTSTSLPTNGTEPEDA
jgi:hypothetical protein